MPPAHRQRFQQDTSAEEIQRKLALIEAYASNPLDDSPEVADETAQARKRCMKDWNEFFNGIGRDPDTVWFDLCEDKDIAKAQARAFLRCYVSESLTSVPCLGPNEIEEIRTVNSAFSLLNVWRNLIAEADATVLRKKRRQEPGKKETWRLKFMDHANRYGKGPVFEVSKWIFGDGARELGLKVEPLTTKIEATSPDVLLIAITMWERADIIPCPPRVRIGFLALLILASIGGFRPKAIMDFRFHQIELALVRDPENPSEIYVAVTIHVPIVKVRASQRGARPSWITFTVFRIPVPAICLASFITSLAIDADAFEPSIDSVATLLERPNLENVNFLPLKWKKEVEDTRIFPLDYKRYSGLWKQACIAAGLRVEPRLYTLRVGAGMDLDGVLADVLRNYIMSNTSSTFQRSYQAQHIRVDLLKTRFGHELKGIGDGNDKLSQLMRTMHLRRDPDAPVQLTKEDKHSIELRKDVSSLREQLKDSATPGQISYNTIKSRLAALRRKLESKMLKKRRDDYFERVDRDRALGYSTARRSDTGTENKKSVARGGDALLCVVRLLREQNSLPTTSKPLEPNLWLETLVSYLSNRPLVSLPTETDRGLGQKSTCFLCNFTFSCQDTLTKHVDVIHAKKGTFKTRFPCPECRRGGRGDFWISSDSLWSKHIEESHGTFNAPLCRRDRHKEEAKLQCPFCGIFAGAGFGRHVLKHMPVGDSSAIFLRPLACQACKHDAPVTVEGWSDWVDHLSQEHPRQAKCLDLPSKRRTPCLLCGANLSSRANLTKHCQARHVKAGTFKTAFQCPECVKHGAEYIIRSAPSWSRHVAQVHGENLAPLFRSEPVQTACPFCGELCSSINSHIQRHIGLSFSKPFSCKLCEHENPSADLFIVNSEAAWNDHVFSAHSQHYFAWTVLSIQCIMCDEEFRPKNLVIHVAKTHLKRLQAGSTVRCHECPSKDLDECSWNQHVNVHHSDLAHLFLTNRKDRSKRRLEFFPVSSPIKRSAVWDLEKDPQECKRVRAEHHLHSSDTGSDLNTIDPRLWAL